MDHIPPTRRRDRRRSVLGVHDGFFQVTRAQAKEQSGRLLQRLRESVLTIDIPDFDRCLELSRPTPYDRYLVKAVRSLEGRSHEHQEGRTA